MFFCSVTSLTFRYSDAIMLVEPGHETATRDGEGDRTVVVSHFDLHGVAVVAAVLSSAFGRLLALPTFVGGFAFVGSTLVAGSGLSFACRTSRRAIPGVLIQLASSIGTIIAGVGRHCARIN